MSARVPFMPQRPASRQQQARSESSAPPPTHDTFRPNGLLSVSTSSLPDPSHDSAASKDTHIPSHRSAEAALKAATNKPLNLAGLAKRKPAPQANGASIPGSNRKSFDAGDFRSSKAFLAPSEAYRLSTTGPRPSSPFFPGSTASGPGYVSTNEFRPPMLPAPSKLHAASSADDLNANHAHTATSADAPGDGNVPSTNGDNYGGLYSLGLNASDRGHLRRRTASHPSLEKINEADDEDAGQLAGHAQDPRLSHGYPEDGPTGSDDGRSEVSQHGLRRSTKRIHQQDFEEDEFTYGNQAKRYKANGHGAPDDFGTRYSRGPTPDIRGFPASEDYDDGALPASRAPSQHPERPYSRMSEVHVHPQGAPLDSTGRGEALYKLLGQDLGAFVDGHVDAYEEAKKKWSECSMDEWRAGADELTTKFAKMLDFVKDHMTEKLSLYASLHSAVASHKSVLAEREKTLAEARESLVKEGGAVVGGSAVASAVQPEKQGAED